MILVLWLLGGSFALLMALLALDYVWHARNFIGAEEEPPLPEAVRWCCPQCDLKFETPVDLARHRAKEHAHTWPAPRDDPCP